ncbi:hypothetical protein HDU84_008668, partial [Entophlyctis sp. JEL0112]
GLAASVGAANSRTRRSQAQLQGGKENEKMDRAARAFIADMRASFPALSKRLALGKPAAASPTSRLQAGAASTFVPSIRKLVVYYNTPAIGHGGDARGMVDFIHTALVALARRRPYVAVEVAFRSSAPAELQAVYADGSVRRHVCYRLSSVDVLRHAEHLCDLAGSSVRVPDALPVGLPEEPTGETTENPAEWKRTRKTPRGSGKERRCVDLRTVPHLEFRPWDWKSVKQTDWKTVGRPDDRKYTWPVLSGGRKRETYWSPFTCPPEERFRP